MFDMENFIYESHNAFSDIFIPNDEKNISVSCSGNIRSLALLYAIYNFINTNNNFKIENLHCTTILFLSDDDYKERDKFMKTICKSLGIRYIPVYSDIKYNDENHKKYLIYKLAVNSCKDEKMKYMLTGKTIDNRLLYFFDNLEYLNNNLSNVTTDYKIVKSVNLKIIKPFIDIFYTKELSDYLKELDITPFNHSDNESVLNLNKVSRNDISDLISTIEEYNISIKHGVKKYTDNYLLETQDAFTLALKPHFLHYNHRIFVKHLILKILKYNIKISTDIDICDITDISKHIYMCPNMNRKFVIESIEIKYFRFNKNTKMCKLIFYKKPNL